jgi:hypothetical protein
MSYTKASNEVCQSHLLASDCYCERRAGTRIAGASDLFRCISLHVPRKAMILES